MRQCPIENPAIHTVKPRFATAGCPVAICGPYSCQLRAVQPTTAGRRKSQRTAAFYRVHCEVLPCVQRSSYEVSLHFLQGIAAFLYETSPPSLRGIAMLPAKYRRISCLVSPCLFAQPRTQARQNGRQSRTRSRQAGTGLWNCGTHLWIFSPIIRTTPIHIIEIYRK